jgi:uncharacterized protein YqfA (UPF0365 family)
MTDIIAGGALPAAALAAIVAVSIRSRMSARRRWLVPRSVLTPLSPQARAELADRLAEARGREVKA